LFTLIPLPFDSWRWPYADLKYGGNNHIFPSIDQEEALAALEAELEDFLLRQEVIGE